MPCTCSGSASDATLKVWYSQMPIDEKLFASRFQSS